MADLRPPRARMPGRGSSAAAAAPQPVHLRRCARRWTRRPARCPTSRWWRRRSGRSRPRWCSRASRPSGGGARGPKDGRARGSGAGRGRPRRGGRVPGRPAHQAAAAPVPLSPLAARPRGGTGQFRQPACQDVRRAHRRRCPRSRDPVFPDGQRQHLIVAPPRIPFGDITYVVARLPQQQDKIAVAALVDEQAARHGRGLSRRRPPRRRIRSAAYPWAARMSSGVRRWCWRRIPSEFPPAANFRRISSTGKRVPRITRLAEHHVRPDLDALVRHARSSCRRATIGQPPGPGQGKGRADANVAARHVAGRLRLPAGSGRMRPQPSSRTRRGPRGGLRS